MSRINPLWKKLREYFFCLTSCTSRSQFFHEAVVGVRNIIRCDSAGVWDSSDLRCLEGIGRSESTAPYNEYYRTVRPCGSDFIVDWGKRDDCEFAVDFMRRYDMYTSLHYRIPGYRVDTGMQRPRWSPIFDEQDLQNLVLVNDYLNVVYDSFDKKERLQNSDTTAAQLADRFPFLSRREADVCSLLSHRMSTSEIAATLFISPRTVEKHVESIFSKLDVRSREQLRWKLGVMPPLRT